VDIVKTTLTSKHRSNVNSWHSIKAFDKVLIVKQDILLLNLFIGAL